MSADKRITLKDVSEYSGYSLRTVKKAMGNTEYVSYEVRKAVHKAAEVLNYKRNRLASALVRNKTFKVALVYADISKYYFPEVERGFEKCLDEYHDFGLTIEYFKCATDQYEWQKDILNTILAREDINAVVIQPMSATGMNDAINRIVDAGKPVVTFGADACKSDRMCYIGLNAYKSGRMAAQIMANYIGKKGNIYIINQLAEHMQTVERSEGFSHYIKDNFPDINIYKVDIPVNVNMYYDIIKSIVLNEDVSGFFCTDADGYVAGKVLCDLDRKDITMIGYDLPEESCKLMRDGFIKVLIYENAELQGYLSLKIMYNYLMENVMPEKELIYIDGNIIISECLS